ncbi:MAG: hypothetical protein NNA21_00260 [Nitrospira sp.]|nr:hypothetical protein [Nitrospira sp.]MCP9460825.1 hypothetical protein [Nitrospira sp.]MCP9474266.1 hypothetical protein [Nitrospira sp.]
MNETGAFRKRSHDSLAVGAVGLLVLLSGLVGCAGEQPKPSSPTVTPDQVRGHADKAFENLKQEERNRTGNQAEPPR